MVYEYKCNAHKYNSMTTLNQNGDSKFSFLKMSFNDWLALPVTLYFETFSDKGGTWLLQQEIPELDVYFAQVRLVTTNNQLYKLDGKHLKEAYLVDKLSVPEYVVAQVFEISLTTLTKLNSDALSLTLTKSLPPQEYIKTIYSELGLVFSSERIKNGSISEAINIALRGRQRIYQDKRSAKEKEEINLKKAINLFREELSIIDAINPDPDIFVTGVLAACLLMLALNKNIIEFLTCINEQRTERREDSFCPVTCVLRAINKYRNTQQVNKKRELITLTEITVQAISIWEIGGDSPGYWRKKDLRGVDIMPYVRNLKTLKSIHAAMDL